MRGIAESGIASAIRPARTSRINRASGSCFSPTKSAYPLTEGMMMDPEASVSALVFHHPDCTYFTAALAGEPIAMATELSL